jgi:hypothetical protein
MEKKKEMLCKPVCSLILVIFLAACSVDNTYDLSKDIDLTMGLGSDGLALKLGNTEKMYLRDILKVEDSDLLDTLTTGDKKSLYYLVKTGNSTINVAVSSITPYQIAPVEVLTGVLYTAPNNIPNANFSEEKTVTGAASVKVDISGIQADVKEIHTIKLGNVNMSIQFSTDNNKFKLLANSGSKLKFPDFIKSTSFNNSQEYTIPDNATSVTIPIQSLEFPKDGTWGMTVVNNAIHHSGNIDIYGTFKVSTNGSVNLVQGETVKVKANVAFSQIAPQEITGLVSPAINPQIDPIQISGDLPDFLKDDEVRLSITNPTVKFIVGGQNLPVPLLFSGTLSSVKNGESIASVEIPESGKVSIASGIQSIYYFSQTASPFDPSGIAASSKTETVSTLNTLVAKLPDQIKIDLGNGNVTTDPSTEHKITLGQNYGATVNYEVLVPFQFNKGLYIVYNDSVDDMNKDLKDYQAEGLTVTATAANTVPLDLVVEIIPIDVNGAVISGISVESAAIAAGSSKTANPVESTLSIKLTPATPADVSRIDKLRLKVKASASGLASGEELLSTQYVELKDLRLKLNGKIIANFN